MRRALREPTRPPHALIVGTIKEEEEEERENLNEIVYTGAVGFCAREVQREPGG